MCFGSSTTTNKNSSTTTANLPAWFEDTAKSNIAAAKNIAARPYVPYSFPRIAPFSQDQQTAMAGIRGFTPGAMTPGQTGFQVPRMIDDIGPGGSVGAYMNPYDQFVIDRGLGNLRRQTDMAQQSFNTGAHQAGAFGDARHGIGAAEIERAAGDTASDFIASNLQRSYDTAQQLRGEDIDRSRQDFFSYLDSLYKSGAAQQELGQKSATTAHEDFLRQQEYPIDMINLLTSVLTGTPHSSTTTTKGKTETPGPSVAGQILGALGSLGSLFI